MIQAFSFLFLSSSSNIYTRRLDTFGDKPVASREIEKERELNDRCYKWLFKILVPIAKAARARIRTAIHIYRLGRVITAIAKRPSYFYRTTKNRRRRLNKLAPFLSPRSISPNRLLSLENFLSRPVATAAAGCCWISRDRNSNENIYIYYMPFRVLHCLLVFHALHCDTRRRVYAQLPLAFGISVLKSRACKYQARLRDNFYIQIPFWPP